MVRRISIVGCMVAALACSGGDTGAAPKDATVTETELREGTPAYDGVSMQLDTSDDGTSALTANSLSEVTVTLVRAVNQRFRETFATIEYALVNSGTPTIEGETGSWAFEADGISWKVAVTRTGTKHFEFLVQGRPVASIGDYVTIAHGELARGASARRGVGFVEIDLTARSNLTPNLYPAKGTVRIRFSHESDRKRLKVRIVDYQETLTDEAPITGSFIYTRLDSGKGGILRVAGTANVWPLSGASNPENLLAIVRWGEGFKGRLDGFAFGGDLPATMMVNRVECWDSTAGLTYGDTWIYGSPDPLGGDFHEGAPDACASQLQTTPGKDVLPDEATLATSVMDLDQMDDEDIPELTPTESY